ncbi:conserved hypothetical protein [Cupriavidus taiwanensis]|nr:conserved hypothetical protein [Cupriavidus taiwanensis]
MPTGLFHVRRGGVDFAYDGKGRGKGGVATLRVNGRSAGQARIERTVPALFSISEPFDVGTDSQSPVGDYSRDYRFAGEIDNVTIDLR